MQQPCTKHRPYADANREHRQQQGHDLAVSPQRIPCDRWEFREQGRADRPEPAQARGSTARPGRLAAACRVTAIVSRRCSSRSAAKGQQPALSGSQRRRPGRSATRRCPAPPTMAGPTSSSAERAARDGSDQDGKEGGRLDHPVAGRQVRPRAGWSGRMPYFSGPNIVACTPRPNSTASSPGTLLAANAYAADPSAAIRPPWSPE